MAEHLFKRSFWGTAPLLVWTAHFAFCYGWVAARCSPALIGPGAPQRWVPALVSVVALGLAGALAWRAWRRLEDESPLLAWACAGSAALALAGIAWTSMPLLLVDGCA